MAQKLGLQRENSQSKEAIKLWLNYLEKEQLDFTLSFRHLSRILESEHPHAQDEFKITAEFETFFEAWKAGINESGEEQKSLAEKMNRKNPFFIPRNHQVEKAISLSYKGDDFLFHRLNQVLKHPYDEDKKNNDLAKAPDVSERVRVTFCGT